MGGCGNSLHSFSYRTMSKRRRHKTESEEEVLERRSHWAQRLNRPASASDKAARARCHELINDGYGAVTWEEITGSK